MIMRDLDRPAARLREMVQAAEVIVPFTGAGISTECGIPDFRSPGGIWTKNQPIPFDEFLASQDARNESWRRRFAMDEQLAAAQPGPRPPRARQPLSRRQGAGAGHAEYRQSASSLGHRGRTRRRTARQYDLRVCASTAPSVTSSHGCARGWKRATACAPDCTDCGGYIKTATISFGQAMPDAAMRRAEELTLSCDLFLSIGSSLVVWPAAGFPLLAKRNGAQLVIINREPTDFDDIADLVVREDIGTVLEPFIVH